MSNSPGRLGACQEALSLPFWFLEPWSREKVETNKGQFSFERGCEQLWVPYTAGSVCCGRAQKSETISLWTFHFSSACVLGAFPRPVSTSRFSWHPPHSPGLALKLRCK